MIHKHDRVHPKYLRIPNETIAVMVCGATAKPGEGNNFLFMQDWSRVDCPECLARKDLPFEPMNASRKVV